MVADIFTHASFTTQPQIFKNLCQVLMEKTLTAKCCFSLQNDENIACLLAWETQRG